MPQLWGDASFLIIFFLCVSPQCAIVFVTRCLAKGSALCRRSDADLHPALRGILVFVPYLCSHLGCSSQCFPWLPLLFAFSGREFSGPRAWLSLVFVQRLGCHGCKQSQRIINHCRIEPRPFPTEGMGREVCPCRPGKGADASPQPAAVTRAAASNPHPYSPGTLLPMTPPASPQWRHVPHTTWPNVFMRAPRLFPVMSLTGRLGQGLRWRAAAQRAGREQRP